jgi:hypothetical protein
MLNNELKNNTLKVLNDSTIYGLKNILKREHVINKLFWIIFLLIGSILSAAYTFKIVEEYLSYKIVTQLERKYQQPLLFPTITFCLDNDRLQLPKNLLDLELFTVFNGKNITNDWRQHFEPFNDYRNCFRFNSGKTMDKNTTNFHYSYVGGIGDSFYLQLRSEYALRIWIHDALQPPKFEPKNDHSNFYLVSPKFRSQIIIEKTIQKKLEYPYNSCYKDVNLFPFNKTIIDYIQLEKKEHYNQIKCFEYCAELDYIETNPCNCTSLVAFDNIWTYCIDYVEKNSFGCTSTYKDSFFSNNFRSKCEKTFCPLECDSITYSVTINSATDIMEKENFIKMIVYFKNLNIISIEQIPKMNRFELIANIGGILAFFIGFSFVSLFEIGELIIKFLIILIKKVFRKITNNY